MPVAPISTTSEFIRSLTAAQRAWYLTEQAARETALQRVLVDLGRALSGVAAAHGEAVHLKQSASAERAASVPETGHGQ